MDRLGDLINYHTADLGKISHNRKLRKRTTSPYMKMEISSWKNTRDFEGNFHTGNAEFQRPGLILAITMALEQHSKPSKHHGSSAAGYTRGVLEWLGQL